MSLEIDNGPYSIYDHSRPGHICISRQTDQGLRCLLIERLKPIYYKKKKKKKKTSNLDADQTARLLTLVFAGCICRMVIKYLEGFILWAVPSKKVSSDMR